MIFCFRHPQYRGRYAPILACKTCCHLFIEELKRCRDQGEELPLYHSAPVAPEGHTQNAEVHGHAQITPKKWLKAPAHELHTLSLAARLGKSSLK